MKGLLGFLVFSVSLAACGSGSNSNSNSNDKSSFTLYQSSVTNPNMRVRLAVYDAPKGKKCDIQKCRTAHNLYQQQADTARFWCEQGKPDKLA